MVTGLFVGLHGKAAHSKPWPCQKEGRGLGGLQRRVLLSWVDQGMPGQGRQGSLAVTVQGQHRELHSPMLRVKPAPLQHLPQPVPASWAKPGSRERAGSSAYPGRMLKGCRVTKRTSHLGVALGLANGHVACSCVLPAPGQGRKEVFTAGETEAQWAK